MNKEILKKEIMLFSVMSIMYVFVEVCYTSISGEMKDNYGTSYYSTIGYSSLYVGLVGGFLGFMLGKFNDIMSHRMPVYIQAIIGAIIITVIELATGYVLNIKLGFHIWDYSGYKFNFLGQISLFRSVGWLVLCPFVFWFDDFIRHEFYREPKPIPLLSYCKNIFKGK